MRPQAPACHHNKSAQSAREPFTPQSKTRSPERLNPVSIGANPAPLTPDANGRGTLLQVLLFIL